MSTKKEQKKTAVPCLRFPEFREAGPWQVKRLDEICEVNPSSGGLPEKFVYIDLDAVVAGRLVKKQEISKDGAPSRAQRLLENGDVIYQTVRPYQKNNFFFNINDGKKYVASTGYAQLRAYGSDRFLFQLVHTYSFTRKVLSKCTGSNYPAINSSDLAAINVFVPSIPEQQKIADCLASLDELIMLEGQRLEALKTYKKGLMQRLFPAEGETVPALRFPEFREAGPWKKIPIREVLDYERPDRYIVNSDNYQSSGTPVLTANKSFILGYTDETDGVYKKVPVIIFDDFTTDKKFVDFPFKVKSSAIKILKSKGENNIRFLYELMTLIRFDPAQHKRYYISEYQDIVVLIPEPIEQQKIADCLASLDEVINLQIQKLAALKAHKKGLMQRLFPQEVG